MENQRYDTRPEVVLYGTEDKGGAISEVKVQFVNSKAFKKISDSNDVADFIKSIYPKDTIELQEQFIILYLDRANQIRGYYRHSIGGIAGTVADPRIILSVALKSLSSGIILAHNHPSGNLKPSEADIQLTKKIKEAASFMDILLLDHLIITKDSYYSFADQGLIGISRKVNQRMTHTKEPKGENHKEIHKETAKKGKKNMGKRVEHIKEDVKFIKRLVGLHNKVKSKNALLVLVKALQRSITEKRITKTSLFVKEIRYVQDFLVKEYNSMKTDKRIIIPGNQLSKFVNIAGGEEVFPSINIIKRFIGMQGKELTSEQTAVFVKYMQRMVKKEKITKEDPYADKLIKIFDLMKEFKKGKLTISKAELNGLQGIIKNCSCCQEDMGVIYNTKGKKVRRCRSKKYSDAGRGACSYNGGLNFNDLGKIYNSNGKKLRRCKSRKYSDASKGACSYNRGLEGVSEDEDNRSKPMNSMDFVKMEFHGLGFKDKWLDFIGDPSAGFTAMVYGRPKFGKSYLCVDFAGYLARNHGKVLYVAKEEGLDATLHMKLTEKLVAHPNLDVFGNLPDDLSPYQFVFLDSVTKLGLTPEDLGELEKKYPSVSFIYIFQVTKGGLVRGRNDYQHDVDIVIEVPEKGVAIQNGRFNQGGEMKIFPEEDQENDGGKTVQDQGETGNLQY